MTRAPTSHPVPSVLNSASLRPEPRAQLIVSLTRLALSAPDIPSAVLPALDTLVERTAAAGSAYFQVGSGMFRARSASGVMPQGPAMEAILAHGLPADTPLMRALEGSAALFRRYSRRARGRRVFRPRRHQPCRRPGQKPRRQPTRRISDAHLRGAHLGPARI